MTFTIVVWVKYDTPVGFYLLLSFIPILGGYLYLKHGMSIARKVRNTLKNVCNSFNIYVLSIDQNVNASQL